MDARDLRTVLFCLPLLWAAPAGAQSVKAGIEAWQKADYSRAVAIWTPLAEAGNTDAAFNLGQAYRLGRGVKTDLASAQTWLERAAGRGHVDAQTTLGLLLFGNGNHADGVKWLSKAAEKGDPRAMLIYGTALFNGDGVPQDRVLGYAFVSRSAAQGLDPAKATLVDMDQIMPLAQRKKGVAIAKQKAKAQPAGTAKVKSMAASVSPEKARGRPVPASGNWRIQVGAFSQRGSASALFDKLSKSPPIAGRNMIQIPAGAMTRLQVGPFESKAAASSACALLSKRGQSCFVVAAQ